MKELRFRLILILAFIGLSLYLLYPTFQDSQNSKSVSEALKPVEAMIKKNNPDLTPSKVQDMIASKKDSILSNNPDYRTAREKRIKLGLDLQGGMYLVMEVNTAKLLEKLAKDPDQQYLDILKKAEAESKDSEENVVGILARMMKEKGIRMSRYFGSIREDDARIVARLQEQETDAVTRAIEIIRNRVDQYGVSEPSIQKQGSRRIVIELPGISREEEARRLLQGRALLEFKLVKDASFAIPIMNRIDEVLAGKVTDSTATAKTDKATNKNQKLTDEQFAKEHPFFTIARLIDPQGRVADAYVKDIDRAKLSGLLAREEVKKVLPDNVEFLYDNQSITDPNGEKFYRMYMVNKEAELTGGVITDARAEIDQTTGSPEVTMQMNGDGAREWSRITGANIDKRCAVVLDGKVYTAPTIINKIPTGSSRITGSANMDEAKLLEIVLKAGALPAPVDIIAESAVGPSLGQDSISQGFNSGWIGYLVVALFMIFYYKTAGSFADLGVIMTVLLTFGVLSAFHATLTLPGIAGIVLSMGMAVDANVLIYERIREELASGKTFKAAVDAGFKVSLSAIFDSNIVTLLTGIILYQFGSGPVQGFALTLMIGIVTSLFSQLVLVRVIFDYINSKGYKINVG
ncbi:MAG: protein-export membrane protein SecD [Stygiobacter sp. RIFOXYA12_FULL_38_9]|nr:MAG: protein-export membrane protein SecD [Stygiobacter sp. GWC2_38_9]OGU82724.1 MAG: protein-export membrane protein SecD [Stygiobacter sp. RIFOXYA12_FULL_38_9]OGV08117.1 MAG: protein-export membrane protein SecD [Stygiobacter sp. RIFOXYB2_FULL_37_11]OGV11883.1 MAG: protein-export membrane protein SecD [Stygiobacter sp. RIFOXYA2_FULL_38_8]OGV15633.1 MAG: protein-export membrane protein SecD [Stygiobacter sp. RIFOXYC2_FULL_38_25]OGV80747.1 MAG: protein-export membrane protein SecD [Stygioba